jgi:hypothetical protein
MKYTCEVCGKSYNNETECTKCEQEHREEKSAEETLMKEIQSKKAELDKKQKEFDVINKEYLALWDKYYTNHSFGGVWMPVSKEYTNLTDFFFGL